VFNRPKAALVAALLLGACAGTPSAPHVAKHGERSQFGTSASHRVVRDVMISQEGSVTLVFEEGEGAQISQRALRLENVNGMLEAVYDTKAPDQALASGGTATLVQGGGGMYSVEYARANPAAR
jgi:hypothetical protein